MVRFPSPRPDSLHSEADVREVKDFDELMVAERVLIEGYPMLELEPLKPGNLLGPTPTRIRPAGLCRRRTVDRLAAPETVGVRRLHREHSGSSGGPRTTTTTRPNWCGAAWRTSAKRS